MSLQSSFKNWQERMSKKSDIEKHNYALTVAFLGGAIALFFVASSWYYRISGEVLTESYFTLAEEFLNKQKINFLQIKTEFNAQTEDISNLYKSIKDLNKGEVNSQVNTTSSTTEKQVILEQNL
jgi:hypothetical protein